MRNKILMTLALLLTAVTGAWAEGTVYNTTVALKDLKAGDVLTNGFSLTTKMGQYIYVKGYKKDGGTAETGDYMQLNAYNSTFPGGVTISESGSTYTPYADGKDANAWIVSDWKDLGSATMLYLDGYNYTPAIDVTPVAGKTNEWTFTMPAFDVEIAPIYAPTAQWAKVENVDQLPRAIEGIYAESTDAIVKAGTVAFAGTSNEVTQGEVMYAVGKSATEQPALTAFSATLPTAKDITAAGDVYVWYYIKGADTPEGDKATAENTFNDSEICATPITVTVLSNKFDIQFKAANANTIEAGKATVTVGGTAATVTDGKLEDVKMGSEVKMTAKPGYKFRKVEVKEKAPTTTVTWNSSDFYFDENPYTKDGVTLTPSIMGAASGNNLYEYGDNTFTTTLGKFIKIEIVFRDYSSPVIDGWTKETAGQYQPSPEQLPDFWADIYKLTWTGNAESVTLKGKDVYGILSITFTIQ